MHLLNPLQAAKQFCSFHSVTPLPHTTSHKHSEKKATPITCGSFFHFDAFRFRRSYLTILTLHCIFIPSATSAEKTRVLRTLA